MTRRPAAARTLLTLLSVLAAIAAVHDLRGRSAARPAAASPLASGGVRLELGRGPDDAGFARVTAARAFRLPADHGAHEQYQTEWWYLTGNLDAAGGEHFGFQLTFFRRGLSPGAPPAGPGLSSNQVYFAHLAVTDVAAGRHAAAERFARGAGGLAGARSEPFSVWLEDWRLEQCAQDERAETAPEAAVAGCAPGWWHLSAADAATGIVLDLQLRAEKPLVAHGDRGVSPKSGEPGNASYYVGYTRLAARGRIGLGDHRLAAAGEAWFDHEWSTSALGAGAVGWDWFSLQLADGRELMYFQIRRADGSTEAVSAGTLVARDGSSRRLARDDVRVFGLGRWRSPQTQISYPSRWRLFVPAERLELELQPWLADQEMRTSFVYWEGAVRVSGTLSGAPLVGQGYVELTGYGRSMQGVF
jgi:predicted secreted hydrolase